MSHRDKGLETVSGIIFTNAKGGGSLGLMQYYLFKRVLTLAGSTSLITPDTSSLRILHFSPFDWWPNRQSMERLISG